MLGLNPWLILGELAAVIAFVVGAFLFGEHVRAGDDAAALAAAEQRVVAQTQTADAITAQTVAASTFEIQQVQQFTQTQIVEVPQYVTAKSDARCAVPRGFVRLHDAGAHGVPPVPLGPGQSDDDSAGIELSAVADTVTVNYGACRATRRQLIDLQGWIEAQQASFARFEHAGR